MLLDYLDAGQATLVRAAVSARVPIIIDGDRSKPTGKSTLRDYLKAAGAVVFEAYELEEGDVQLDDNTGINTVCVTIQLNKELFI